MFKIVNAKQLDLVKDQLQCAVEAYLTEHGWVYVDAFGEDIVDCRGKWFLKLDDSPPCPKVYLLSSDNAMKVQKAIEGK